MKNNNKYKVSPNLYTKEYFLSDNYGGIKEYRSGLEKPSSIVEYILKEISFSKEKKLFLDAGCGKGEGLYFMSKKNYSVFGVDYSWDAVEMTKDLLKKFGIQGKVIKADVRNMPFPNDYFDIVISMDVIEHLDNNNSALGFINEIYRVLKSGGVFYLHTSPNKLFVDYFKKYYQRYINFIMSFILRPFIKNKVTSPLEIRNDYEKTMHVNEQTYFSIKNNLEESNFKKYNIKMFGNPFKSKFKLWRVPYYIVVYFFPLNKLLPFNIILGEHIFFTAKK